MATKKLDLVLINPASRLQVYQALGKSLAAIENPVWAGLIAGFVRGRGFSVEIIDAEAEGLTPEQTAERVHDLDPTLAAVVIYGHQPSASTQIMPSVRAVCGAIKEHSPTQPILLVGGHAAALPERTLTEEEADFVAGGEGLFTIIDLIEALRSESADLAKVRDLWYRDGGIHFTRPAPLVQNLDEDMPGQAWDLVPMERYRAHNWHCFGDLERQPYAAIYTTLGCPYRCSFCCIQAPFKSGERALRLKETANSYRFWSPERVIAQIDLLVNRYGVRNLKIADEMFVLNRKHVLGICDLILERGYDLNIWAYARVDTIKDDVLERLRRAGFRWLALGIEAASQRVRSDVSKRFEQRDIFDAVQRIRAAGIHVIGNYIFGLPEDDLDSMQATLDLAQELNCEFANFYCAMAYPGSPLYQQALQQGWALPESWSGYSQHAVDTLCLPTRHLTAGEVLRFRDEAFHTYFGSRRYRDMIGAIFGSETERHIEEMTRHKLMRRHAGATGLVSTYS